MRRLASTSLTLLLLLPACGDDDGGTETTVGTTGTTTDETGTTAEPETGTTAETGTGTTAETGVDTTADTGIDTTADTGVDTTAGTETGTTEGTTTEGTTTGGMATLEATMSDLVFFQDCMPIVASDPVGAMFMLELTNPGDEEKGATVASATLYDVVGVEVGTIEVMPTELGPVPPDDTVMVAVTKVPDSLMPANGCEVLECNGSYELQLALDVGGEEVLAESTAMVDCVF